MSRIDAQVATQVADVVRPAQTSRDQHLQTAAATQRSAVANADDGVLGVDAPSASSLSSASSIPSAVEVRRAAAYVKQVIEAASGNQLTFDVDDTGKTLLVKVVGDKGEVIRQIPSKEVLELHRRIDSIIGVLIDHRA